MPSTEVNRHFWGTAYDWSGRGDEWSSSWGGAESQWHGTLFPRIRHHLPAQTILEIAPGFGRWTQFLAGFCERLILVDLSQKCIDACRSRFRDLDHVEYHVNDGRSLSFVRDSSVDFVFSFDSLVHVEADVIEAYLFEMGRVLKEGGSAFIHHSNFAEFRVRAAIDEYLNLHPQLNAVLTRLGLVKPTTGRGFTVSAVVFRELAERAGVPCTGQEKVNWAGKLTIDCFSTVRKSRDPEREPMRSLHNPHFMRESQYLACLARIYDQAHSD